MFPRGFGRPQGHKSGWPEALKEMLIFMNDEGDGLEIIVPDFEVAKPKPSLREMNELEMVFDWMRGLAAECKRRRIPYVARTVWLGMLHNPVTGKRCYSWSRIAKRFSVSRPTPKAWYDDGITIITRQLNGDSGKVIKTWNFTKL